MGEHQLDEETGPNGMRAFVRSLLRDVEALERMLDEDRFDRGHRVGAELEMFLVDEACRPARVAEPTLLRASDERLVTELAKFNLEANASPLLFRGNCLTLMRAELEELVAKARSAATEEGARILLSGILPTLRKGDLGLDSMAEQPRYRRLNDAIVAARGGAFDISIAGADELAMHHDNVMLESANTSFQIHFQVEPEEFARLYNAAQLVTAPLLAVAVNSPLFMGKRLWSETRIALFQRSIDERKQVQHARQAPPRVSFGDSWVQESVLEVFREQIARFRVVLPSSVDENSLECLDRDQIPKLRALCLHNGTIYRWNRACYGVADGVPHLRIENRALPAGPSMVDQVANAALFFGLMASFRASGEDVARQLSFGEAKSNFYAAARHGLRSQFHWRGGRAVSAGELIKSELLPMARAGLTGAGVERSDIDHYLDIIEARVASGQTGAAWVYRSLAAMSETATMDMKEHSVVAAQLREQASGRPVHEWELAPLGTGASWKNSYERVEQFMTRKLFTVRQDDSVDLAASLMSWEHIRHVPVEDEEGKLVGLLTHRSLMELATADEQEDVLVSDLMLRDPVCIPPHTRSLDAMRLMREKQVSCLPVVDGGVLVGIVTERDLVEASIHLLEGAIE